MARTCDICERGPQVGNRRSHSNISTKRRLLLNLQTRRIDGKKLLMCTTCLKTRKKTESKK